MNGLLQHTESEIERLTAELLQQQQPDGSWRFCFDNGTTIDAFFIILLRSLENDKYEPLLRRLHDRIVRRQRQDGGWSLYEDEEAGNLSSSVDAYYALLYSGYSSHDDGHMRLGRRFITAGGGLGGVTSVLSKTILAATGQRPWPKSINLIPPPLVLFPPSFPVSLYDFSSYARIHLVPMLVMAERKLALRTETTPDLSHLLAHNAPAMNDADAQAHDIAANMQAGLSRLIGRPALIRETAIKRAEQFMLDRIEVDGTLYSYASCTILMIFALLALGYESDHPVIAKAVAGMAAMRCELHGDTSTIQNSPSAIWDTALLSHALQEARLPPDHEAIVRSSGFLLRLQHRTRGDWSVRNPNAEPGGWGFSESNTIHPDVDDTTAALRAIHSSCDSSARNREAWNRGLAWVLSMQNKDGGWGAFEKNNDKQLLTLLPIDGAKAAAIDPSIPDLTGRTLEYLGRYAGLDIRHSFIRRGAEWLIRHQEKDGSWYGRWGICYIYGTWAALTGMRAAGVPAGHDSIARGTEWLLRIQNEDGGWGESCSSDARRRYVPLGGSTPSQTAWALEALMACREQPTQAIHRGVARLIALLREHDWKTIYPTGAGLPGHFYAHYESYAVIWPLLALCRYRNLAML
ncbi:squalene--hopene cyclase [Paenibacillus sp. J5C_2022]|uniref:squalene--hopene cyclase n=1 Tax=Paenibacillus sp. J5C2022 TaxID=2977129 RepID=UPI0021D126A9|nr:squalene--hopene cyclase [Paenibacillus sp. J5C2022]MCU6707462.1 squalene--hopene cyclase [Paenibacillus sp. J5C2022]